MSIRKIARKVLNHRRISPEDALRLFECDDIHTLAELADYTTTRFNGSNAYFILNHHINPTNICVNRCRFCAFSKSKGEDGAYELTVEEIVRKLKRHGRRQRFTELHLVGGLHPEWTFEHYLSMLRQIKRRFPDVTIKAFTAVEIDYFSRISRLSLSEIFSALREAGLDLMPGGGAEIFDPCVRRKICPEKISGKRWLEVMRSAHRAGIMTNATMLYGHVEDYRHRVHHLLKLRELQDQTDGFLAFIPLAFHPVNTDIDVPGYTSGIDDLKTIAISRIFLDNFPHIKAYWIMLGEKVAQIALMSGADDIDGTIIEERITHSAGALSGTEMTVDEMVTLIRAAGKVPVERDSFYNPIRVYGE